MSARDRELLATLEEQGAAIEATLAALRQRIADSEFLAEIAALTAGEFFVAAEVAPLLSDQPTPRDLSRRLSAFEAAQVDGFSVMRGGRERTGTLWRVRSWA